MLFSEHVQSVQIRPDFAYPVTVFYKHFIAIPLSNSQAANHLANFITVVRLTDLCCVNVIIIIVLAI